MSVGAIRGPGWPDPSRMYGAVAGSAPPQTPGFAAALRAALGQADALQANRDEAVREMVAGRVDEAHDVMVAAEEAQLAFELMLEVRNRLLEAYQEIMRLQV